MADKSLKENLNIAAPVVEDATTRTGLLPLVRFIDLLTKSDHADVSAKESERLAPYFNAMSDYVGHVLKQASVQEIFKDKEEHARNLSDPKMLGDLFNGLARKTKTLLLSEIVLLPDSVIDHPAVKALFDQPHFRQNYYTSGHMFNFGFLQLFKKGDEGEEVSSVTVPTLMLDRKMMAAIAPYQPQAVLKGLQDMMTFVNHDMLHQLTVPILNKHNSEIARNFLTVEERKSGKAYDWTSKGLGYEDWAQIAHEQIVTGAMDQERADKVCKDIGLYFDALEHVRDAMLARGGADAAVLRERAHEAIDYFGVMMAHSLTRVFPLNHPVMEYCLERMEKADPMPQAALFDCYQNTTGYLLLKRKEIDPVSSADKRKPAQVMEKLQGKINGGTAESALGRIMAGYRKAGFDVFPSQSADVQYRHFKMYHLLNVGFSDASYHTPNYYHEGIGAQRTETAKEVTLNAILAADDFLTPPPPAAPDSSEPVVLLYSEKAARTFGYKVASVPDESGWRKEVPYTAAVSSGQEAGYLWEDKTEVWMGSRDDMCFLRIEKFSPERSIVRNLIV